MERHKGCKEGWRDGKKRKQGKNKRKKLKKVIVVKFLY